MPNNHKILWNKRIKLNHIYDNKIMDFINNADTKKLTQKTLQKLQKMQNELFALESQLFALRKAK